MGLRIFLSLLLLLPASCQLGNPYDPVPKQLMPQVELFGDIVRWRDLRKMYAFGKAGSRWPVQEGLDNIRVTGYEAGALNEIRPWRWGQSVLISYVLVDRQVVRQALDQQVWVSEDQGKTWFRENPPPRF